MGGGSSSDEKTNQINKKAYEQLQKQVLNSNQQNPPQKGKSKLKSPQNSPKNSPKISPKNSPRNNKSDLVQEAPPQSNFKNKKFDSPRQSKNPSSLKGKQQPNNQDMINEKDVKKASRQDREILGNIEFNKKGQYKVGILLLKMTPGEDIGKQIKLQKTQSTYEATLKWNFDQKIKKWNFFLEKPQSTELSFTVNQKGQVIKGQQDKWELFNPSYADLPRKQTQFYKQQFITQSLERNSYWLPSFEQLKSNKRSLCSDWNQEYTERAVQFPPVRSFAKTGKNEGSLTEFKAYHEIRKFFEKESDDWQLTLDIVENEYKFHAFMTWKLLSQDNNLNELVERHKRILELKKQIYIQKLKLLTV